ncbi:MAG: hypothetical protein AAFW83_01665 [Pseudomonadota bacterium]
MNRLKSILMAGAFSMGTITAPAFAGNLAIVISPNGKPDAKRAEMQDIIRLMATAVDPGEKAAVFDGMTGKTICEFIVPDRKSYASDKAKINANRACIGRLLKFAKDADQGRRHGALNLPQSLRTIVSTLDMASTDAVVIAGSPIYDDPREPSVSMLNGDYPSAGYITVEPSNSPYSMAGLEGRLQGTPVYFTYDDYDWVRNNRYKDGVYRFVGMTMKALGGPLVTFNNDRKQMINSVLRGESESLEDFEIPSSQKLEMIYVRPDAGGRIPIHERPLTNEIIPVAQRRRAIDVEVGITWNCNCDLDVYIRPFDGAEIIFYGNRRTNEGQFYRDYRNGEELLNGLESVSFYAPVDLDKMVIAVNLYRGDVPEGATGEIRISVGDKTWGKSFLITATEGNEGDGAEETFIDLRPANDAWVLEAASSIIISN